MAKDSKDLNGALQSLGWEIHEAQCVLTCQSDITGVVAWLSKEGTLYFEGGWMEPLPHEIESELKKAGYHVVPRFEPKE